MDACDFASSSLSSKVSQQTKWRIHFFFFPIGKVNPPGEKKIFKVETFGGDKSKRLEAAK